MELALNLVLDSDIENSNWAMRVVKPNANATDKRFMSYSEFVWIRIYLNDLFEIITVALFVVWYMSDKKWLGR